MYSLSLLIQNTKRKVLSIFSDGTNVQNQVALYCSKQNSKATKQVKYLKLHTLKKVFQYPILLLNKSIKSDKRCTQKLILPSYA